MIRDSGALSEVEDSVPTGWMPFATPQYSRSRVNAAGDTLIKIRTKGGWWRTIESQRAYHHSLDVINNWRSSHSGPLLHMRMLLTSNAASVDANTLIAQRIKRLSSIEQKLLRFSWLKLSQMQDIGGCRAIVGSVDQVNALSDKLERSRTQHKFDHKDDYISKPQDTGYRGIHLISLSR